MTIGVNVRIELFLGSSFPLSNALIFGVIVSCCASMMIPCSILFNSSGVSSPVARCSTGLRQLLMNLWTQLCTRTSQTPISSLTDGFVLYHLEKRLGSSLHWFSFILLVTKLFRLFSWERSVSSWTSAFSSSSVSAAAPVNPHWGQFSFVLRRNSGPRHQHLLSISSSTVNPRVPWSAEFNFPGT